MGNVYNIEVFDVGMYINGIATKIEIYFICWLDFF